MSAKKRNYRKKPKSSSDEQLEDQEAFKDIDKDKDSEDVRYCLGYILSFVFVFIPYSVYWCSSGTIEELIELRKYRRRPQGIDVEKLSKGEAKAKKKKKDDDPWKLTAGGLVDLDEVRENEE